MSDRISLHETIQNSRKLTHDWSSICTINLRKILLDPITVDNRRWSSYREYRNIDEYRCIYRYNSRATKVESCEAGLIELEIATLNTTKSRWQSIPLAVVTIDWWYLALADRRNSQFVWSIKCYNTTFAFCFVPYYLRDDTIEIFQRYFFIL